MSGAINGAAALTLSRDQAARWIRATRGFMQVMQQAEADRPQYASYRGSIERLVHRRWESGWRWRRGS
jgi:hypothetical protein